MEELTLVDSFALLRRWKKVLLTTICVLLALSFIFVLHWSNYRSTAVVQIEQPEISSSATTPTGTNPREVVETLADQRINKIEQKVLSTSSLTEIITKFNLYPGIQQNAQIADVAERMKKKIKLELLGGTLANPAAANKDELSAIAFRLSFEYSDPVLTQKVADELVTRFLDQDLEERLTETRETSAFLAAQIAEMETAMSEQEKKIADYQNEHGASQPENLAFNQQAASSLLLNLQTLDSQIAATEGNIGSLRAQLATVDPYSRVIGDGQVTTTPTLQLKSLKAQYATLKAQYGPEHPDVVKAEHQIEALQQLVGGTSKDTAQLKAQITDVQTNLSAAEKTYGPDHPDVLALKNQLRNLQDQQNSAGKAHASGTQVVADADNPSYLLLVSQLHAAEEEHKSLLERRKELQVQQDTYQKAIAENPEAEKEMAQLSRDYENAKMRYRELKEKKMSADMDEQMQQDHKGQRLAVIEPPELPVRTQPGRGLLLLASILFSFIGGIASVVMAQMLSQSILGPRHLEALTGVAPLVAIPHIFTKKERERFHPFRSNIVWNAIKRLLNGMKPKETGKSHG